MKEVVERKIIEEKMNNILSHLGRLAKQFLLNTEYGRKPFVSNPEWISSLGLIRSEVEAVITISGTTVSDCIDGALRKYVERKKNDSLKKPNFDEFSSETEFYQAALNFSNNLFGKGTIETNLLDLVSEVSELHGEFISNDPFYLTKNWYDELGDVAYLLLRLGAYS